MRPERIVDQSPVLGMAGDQAGDEVGLKVEPLLGLDEGFLGTLQVTIRAMMVTVGHDHAIEDTPLSEAPAIPLLGMRYACSIEMIRWHFTHAAVPPPWAAMTTRRPAGT